MSCMAQAVADAQRRHLWEGRHLWEKRHLCRRAAPAQLPGTDAIGDPFNEVILPHDRFDASEPHSFADVVAHARKGEGDALIMQIPN